MSLKALRLTPRRFGGSFAGTGAMKLSARDAKSAAFELRKVRRVVAETRLASQQEKQQRPTVKLGETTLNLGGEGEVEGVVNVQGPWVLDPCWRASSSGKSLKQLQDEGHVFIIALNTTLPIADKTVDTVVTNSTPIDTTTFLGPGVQSSEVERILVSHGEWFNNGDPFFVKK